MLRPCYQRLGGESVRDLGRVLSLLAPRRPLAVFPRGTAGSLGLLWCGGESCQIRPHPEDPTYP